MVERRVRALYKPTDGALAKRCLSSDKLVQESPAPVQPVGMVLKLNGAATVKVTENNAGRSVVLCYMLYAL
jgi:hypothetical protein